MRATAITAFRLTATASRSSSNRSAYIRLE